MVSSYEPMACKYATHDCDRLSIRERKNEAVFSASQLEFTKNNVFSTLITFKKLSDSIIFYGNSDLGKIR